MTRTGLGRSTIYRWIGQGKFPRGVKLAETVMRWEEDELEGWVAQRKQSSAY